MQSSNEVPLPDVSMRVKEDMSLKSRWKRRAWVHEPVKGYSNKETLFKRLTQEEP